MAGEYRKAKQLFDTMLSAGHAPAEAFARVVSGYRLTAFLLVEPPMRPDPAPAKSRLYVYYTIGRDRNGNKLVHVKTSGRGGFSIQTNGNLPRTHRDGVTVETDAEVCAYVAAHGSERQKRILGI